MGLSEGCFSGGDVAAVAIDHEHPFEAMPAEGENEIVQHRKKGGRLQTHGS